MVLQLLRGQAGDARALGESIIRLVDEIRYCNVCNNISETETCDICSDPRRDRSLVCVVEDIRDVIAIENTGQYKGVYHILGGLISPMDGIGPGQLNIVPLLNRTRPGNVREVVFALPATTEGDTTNFYLYRKLGDSGVEITSIARGISFGGELEFTDEVTLGRSILQRQPYRAQTEAGGKT